MLNIFLGLYFLLITAATYYVFQENYPAWIVALWLGSAIGAFYCLLQVCLHWKLRQAFKISAALNERLNGKGPCIMIEQLSIPNKSFDRSDHPMFTLVHERSSEERDAIMIAHNALLQLKPRATTYVVDPSPSQWRYYWYNFGNFVVIFWLCREPQNV